MLPADGDPADRERAIAALNEAIAACRLALRAALAARDEGQIATLQDHLANLLRKKAGGR